MALKMKFDDLVESLCKGGDSSLREVFSCQSGSASLTLKQACRIFPELKESSAESVVYVPVNMAHSFPCVNAKGRGFTESVLRDSASGLQDSLVNEEHRMNAQYLGHVRSAVFNPSELREAASCLYDDPGYAGGKPLVALTALYLRNPTVAKVVSEHEAGNKWYVSMECLHDLREAAAYYEGEFIPLVDAPEEMIACIGRNSVKKYNDRELAIALGGVSGKVKFDALAFTKTPADANGDVLGFYTPKQEDKKFFPGLSFSTASMREAASFSVDLVTDKEDREHGSIGIIGQTEPASDGHVHDVTSTLDIMITNGHTHWLQQTSLDVGTKPTLTGLVSEHHVYDDMGNQVAVHNHLINIPLKTAKAKTVDTSTALTRAAASKLEGDSIVSKLLEKMRELGSRLDKLTDDNKDGKSGEAILVAARELASVDLDEALAEAIADQVKDGSLVKKDDVAKQIKDASDAAILSYKEHADTVTSREKQVSDLGIDLAHVISGEGDSAVTVKDFVGGFAVDDDGTKQFNSQLAVMSSLVPKNEAAEAKAKEDADAKAKADATAREAASTGILKIVGGGPTRSTASSSQNDKPKVGRYAFS